MMHKTEGYTHAQAEILKYVFNHGKVSRAELAQALNVSNLTVINGVKKLLEDGVLAECGTLPSERGRKVTLLSVNPELHHFLAVDIGAHTTKLAVIRFDGSIIYKEQHLNERRDVWEVYITPQLLREKIAALIQKFSKLTFSALCFCISGTVDFANKQSLFCANVQGWNGVDFQKEFGDHFDLPVYLDSSGHCYAMAERQFGLGKNISDLIFISIGHSICTGIIQGGKLLRGVSGAAGELGHIQVRGEQAPHTWKCTCGRRNCLEMHATLPVIRMKAQRYYAELDPTWIPTRNNVEADAWLKEAFAAQDPFAVQAVENAARILGQQVATVADLLNPKMIVFGGGTIYAFPQMIETIRREILNNSLSVISQELTVELSTLGPDAALQGAALLAIYDILKNSTEKTA